MQKTIPDGPGGAAGRRWWSGVLAGILLLAGAAPTGAAPAWGDEAIPDRELARMRGGFINAEGLKIDVGLESLVRVNGELRSAVDVQLPDLTELATGAGGLASQLEVIQNGPGNSLPGNLADQVSGLGTVIQNSLNDQVIQNLKSLNIDIRGYRGLGDAQLKGRIQSQIIDSLR